MIERDGVPQNRLQHPQPADELLKSLANPAAHFGLPTPRASQLCSGCDKSFPRELQGLHADLGMAQGSSPASLMPAASGEAGQTGMKQRPTSIFFKRGSLSRPFLTQRDEIWEIHIPPEMAA